MIKVKHPDPECNRKQEALINNAPLDQRRFHELMFTHGNIIYRYHRRAKEFSPTIDDWKEWLEGLPENIRTSMEKEGFERGKRAFPFTRYVMEKNDIGLDEYVRQRMDQDDYLEWKNMINRSEDKP